MAVLPGSDTPSVKDQSGPVPVGRNDEPVDPWTALRGHLPWELHALAWSRLVSGSFDTPPQIVSLRDMAFTFLSQAS